ERGRAARGPARARPRRRRVVRRPHAGGAARDHARAGCAPPHLPGAQHLGNRAAHHFVAARGPAPPAHRRLRRPRRRRLAHPSPSLRQCLAGRPGRSRSRPPRAPGRGARVPPRAPGPAARRSARRPAGQRRLVLRAPPRRRAAQPRPHRPDLAAQEGVRGSVV
ncbi:MAG: hypothetical protein AVDCRST_MAG68-21, partial [uncultured Gemmatimonadetes bacterium]